MFRALLLDLDGVVIDSVRLMRFAFAESYRRVVGGAEPPVDEYLSHSGDAFHSIMDKMGLPRSLQSHFREISISNMHMIETVPGIRNVLEKSVERKIKIGLVTGKESDRTAAILSHLDLARYFSVAVCSDMVARAKPDPESVYRALADLDVDANHTLLVGDARNDIISAKRAGVTALGATWGTGSRHDLIDAGADGLADEPREIITFLENHRPQKDRRAEALRIR